MKDKETLGWIIFAALVVIAVYYFFINGIPM